MGRAFADKFWPRSGGVLAMDLSQEALDVLEQAACRCRGRARCHDGARYRRSAMPWAMRSTRSGIRKSAACRSLTVAGIYPADESRKRARPSASPHHRRHKRARHAERRRGGDQGISRAVGTEGAVGDDQLSLTCSRALDRAAQIYSASKAAVVADGARSAATVAGTTSWSMASRPAGRTCRVMPRPVVHGRRGETSRCAASRSRRRSLNWIWTLAPRPGRVSSTGEIIKVTAANSMSACAANRHRPRGSVAGRLKQMGNGSAKNSACCVVGAGVTGLVAIRELVAEGFDVQAYEKTDDVIGISRTRSTTRCRLLTSKRATAFKGHPMPDSNTAQFPTDNNIANTSAPSFAKEAGRSATSASNTAVVSATLVEKGTGRLADVRTVRRLARALRRARSLRTGISGARHPRGGGQINGPGISCTLAISGATGLGRRDCARGSAPAIPRPATWSRTAIASGRQALTSLRRPTCSCRSPFSASARRPDVWRGPTSGRLRRRVERHDGEDGGGRTRVPTAFPNPTTRTGP